jgi:hypothetical protein
VSALAPSVVVFVAPDRSHGSSVTLGDDCKTQQTWQIPAADTKVAVIYLIPPYGQGTCTVNVTTFESQSKSLTLRIG